MRRITVEHHDGYRGGSLVVRDGDLRFRPTMPVSGVGSSFTEPDPEPCCADAPGDELTNANDELIDFFDRWYGSGNRSTVFGGTYYTWNGAPCGSPNVLVPEEAYLLTMGEPDNRCGTNPPIHTVFNRMRDATEKMADHLRLPPTDETLACEPLDVFSILWTPTRPCPIELSDPRIRPQDPCQFSSGHRRYPDRRVQEGQKLCTYHYLELEATVLDIKSRGVVFGVLDFRASSDAPECNNEVGFLCETYTRLDYVANPVLVECCGGSDDNDLGCCYQADLTTVSGYRAYRECEFWDRTFGSPAACIHSNCSPDSAILRKCTETVAQSGVATRDGCEFTIPVEVTRVITQPCWPENCNDCGTFVTASTRTLNLNDIGYVDNFDGCGQFATWFPGAWNESRRTQSGACQTTNDVCGTGVQIFWECVEGSADCTGEDRQQVGTCINRGGQFACDDCNCVSLIERDVTVTGATGSCSGSNCEGGYACPGDLDSTTITKSLSTIPDAIPYWQKHLDENGSGYENIYSYAGDVRLPTCPDAGVTGVVMFDDRLPTASASWQSFTLTADEPDDPDCPGDSLNTEGPLCVYFYGTLGT